MVEKHTHYHDYRDVRGDGRIILYRRADIQSQNWTARLKIPDTVGYVVKSTKTSDDFEARRFAEELYYELEGRSRRGEPVKSPTFKWVFEQWKASLGMDRRVRSARYVDGNIRRMEIWALPHLGQLPINTINESVLAQHIQWRVDQAKKPPAIATLRTERTVLNQIFRFAKREGYVSDLPEITLPTIRQNSRPDIPDKEWRKLYTYLRRYVKEAQDKRRYRERFYLQHYILILANSGTPLSNAVLNSIILRHVHDCQHSLEQDRARFLRQDVESGFDEGLHQFNSIRLPQAPAALHELFFRRIAAALQNRCKPLQCHSQRLIKLCVYSVNHEFLPDTPHCH